VVSEVGEASPGNEADIAGAEHCDAQHDSDMVASMVNTSGTP